MTPIRTRPVFVPIALLLTLALFVLGGHPATAGLFSESYHDWVHIAAFASVVLAYGLAFPGLSLLAMAIFAVGLGIVHEIFQIFTPAHAFEADDAIYNSAGALIGAIVSRVPLPARIGKT